MKPAKEKKETKEAVKIRWFAGRWVGFDGVGVVGGGEAGRGGRSHRLRIAWAM